MIKHLVINFRRFLTSCTKLYMLISALSFSFVSNAFIISTNDVNFMEEDSNPLFHVLLELEHLTEKERELILNMSTEEDHPIDFSKAWQYSDLSLVVEGKNIFASKMILSLWSPVFKAMFSGDFVEKNAAEIKLPGKKFNDMIELMRVLHPPNKEITDENVLDLLPLVQEYQIEVIAKRSEEFLLSQASSVKNFLIAEKFNLKELYDSNMSYLKRCPVVRLKTQLCFDELDQQMLVDLLMEKCEKFEQSVDALREVRMVLERKKPTTFPGMHLLCDRCTAAREQQVDCDGCMKGCCKKITEILRNLER